MTHQEVADFVIDVFEAKLYGTATFFGISVKREFGLGWVLTYGEQ